MHIRKQWRNRDMIVKAIVAFLLVIIHIHLMYSAIIAIKEDDKSYAVICSTGAGLVGIVCGFVFGSLIL